MVSLKSIARVGLLWAALAMMPAVVQAQFIYTVDNGKVIITGYTGSGGDVTIPDTTNGLPVTSIGDAAFFTCTNLTTVAIGTGVVSIGNYAFSACNELTAITVHANNPAYSSLDGVLFDKNQTTLIQCPGGKTGNHMIPNGVTNIGDLAFAACSGLRNVTIQNGVIDDSAFRCCYSLTNVTLGTNLTSIGYQAFSDCSRLASVTIPNGVTSIAAEVFSFCSSLTTAIVGNGVTRIGTDAFYGCTNLTSVYFRGDAPSLDSYAFLGTPTTFYYLPETAGWETFPYSPVILWNPQAKADAYFGERDNCFGFTFTNAGSPVIVVEACTNLVNPTWSSLATNTLTNGSSYFSDPCWTNSSARFYRFRSP